MKTLEITTYIDCPNKCSYCPQSVLLKAYTGKREMTMSDLARILNNTPKDVRIDFSGMSEVFCHQDAARLIRFTFTQGFSIVLYTTLVGFDQTDIDTLRGVKFAEVVFHQYPGVDLKFFESKKELFQKHIQTGRTAVITSEWLWSRAGNVFERETVSGPYLCLYARKEFNHNVVLPNGDVYLCCQDYGLKHCIGNLYTTNFNDLNRRDIIAMSYEDESVSICRMCEIRQNI
jgi:radical SAM protein with 4Fe4S-binding SPASM domain